MRMIGASFADWYDDYYDGVDLDKDNFDYYGYSLSDKQDYINSLNDISDDHILSLMKNGGQRNQSK
ncbi:hypothetical protein [Paenibacillus chitinolyticus]|uniref:hypothetical protein n=1 Tax=Paenibacillus chitinolyticus TaxID=79263 RepID=UPI0036704287